MENSYSEGAQAFEDGIQIEDNPYYEKSGQYKNWRQGWRDAAADEEGGTSE